MAFPEHSDLFSFFLLTTIASLVACLFLQREKNRLVKDLERERIRNSQIAEEYRQMENLLHQHGYERLQH